MGVVVGLCGYARAGKDEFADAMGEEGFVRFAFADALKDVALESEPTFLWDYGHEPLSSLVKRFGWEDAKAIPGVRQYLQRLGVAMRTHVHEDVWVDAVHNAITRAGAELVVITDVRFVNEVAWVERMGGVMVRIDRPGVGPANGHSSEVLAGNLDTPYWFHNVGTLEEWRLQGRAFARGLRAGESVGVEE